MDEIRWARLTRATLLSGLLALGVATIAPLPGATLPADRLDPPRVRPAEADGAAAAIEALGRELAAARRRIAELEAAGAGTGDAAARVAELTREVEDGWRWIEELNAVLASTCVAQAVARPGGAAGGGREDVGRDAGAPAPVLLARVMGRPSPGRL